MRNWRIPSALLLALAATSASASVPALEFEHVFHERGEPEQIYYRAEYETEERPHRLEVWRDRDHRLRRRTDDAIETFVFKPVPEADWRMVVLDLRRKVRTDIDRANLARIGHFSDWFSLSHALARPAGPYQLAAASAPAGLASALGPCQWYALTQGGAASRICWSAAWHLPLLIVGHDDKLQWRVTKVDTQPLPPVVYQIHDQGFARANANEDMLAD